MNSLESPLGYAFGDTLPAPDIVPIMFRRKLDAHQLTFAMGEALATCTSAGTTARCGVKPGRTA